MSGESKSLKQALEAINPDWSITVPRGRGFADPNTLNVDCYVYPVDAKSGWIGLAGLRSQNAMSLISDGRAGKPVDIPEAIRLAGSAIVDAAAVDAGASDKKTEVAALLSLLAISSTNSFTMVMNQAGSIAGHWVYLCYQTNSKDRELICRPAYMSAREPGLLPTQELRDFIRKVVKADRGSPDSSVGRGLREAGGPIICREFNAVR